MDVNNSLKEQLVLSMFRFKKMGTSFPAGMDLDINKLDINMVELAFMKNISENDIDSDENVCASELQNFLYITKAAVSQMVGALEKKGYLNRDINKQNRRKITLTLTPKGQDTLKYMEESFDKLLTKIISQLGEDDTKQFVRILNRFADIIDELKNENN
jgi:DNA-binding MarR family transcriptional regulator